MTDYSNLQRSGYETIDTITHIGHQLFSEALNFTVPIINNIARNTNISNNDVIRTNVNRPRLKSHNLRVVKDEDNCRLKYAIYMPGVPKENVNINVNNGKLIIRANTNVSNEVIDLEDETERNIGNIDFSNWDYLQEFEYNKELDVPYNTTSNSIRCTIHDGILKIYVKKTGNYERSTNVSLD